LLLTGLFPGQPLPHWHPRCEAVKATSSCANRGSELLILMRETLPLTLASLSLFEAHWGLSFDRNCDCVSFGWCWTPRRRKSTFTKFHFLGANQCFVPRAYLKCYLHVVKSMLLSLVTSEEAMEPETMASCVTLFYNFPSLRPSVDPMPYTPLAFVPSLSPHPILPLLYFLFTEFFRLLYRSQEEFT
jgi:hypothetical protein